MKKIKILVALALLAFPLTNVLAQSANPSGEVPAGSKILSDKNGIKVYETKLLNASTNNVDKKLNFMNSNQKNLLVWWNVVDGSGKVLYKGSSMTLAPGMTVAVDLNAGLEKAVDSKNSSVQIKEKN